MVSSAFLQNEDGEVREALRTALSLALCQRGLEQNDACLPEAAECSALLLLMPAFNHAPLDERPVLQLLGNVAQHAAEAGELLPTSLTQRGENVMPLLLSAVASVIAKTAQEQELARNLLQQLTQQLSVRQVQVLLAVARVW